MLRRRVLAITAPSVFAGRSFDPVPRAAFADGDEAQDLVVVGNQRAGRVVHAVGNRRRRATRRVLLGPRHQSARVRGLLERAVVVAAHAGHQHRLLASGRAPDVAVDAVISVADCPYMFCFRANRATGWWASTLLRTASEGDHVHAAGARLKMERPEAKTLVRAAVVEMPGSS